MTNEHEKSVVKSNLKVGVFTIYDCVLKQFEPPFTIQETALTDYLKLIVNDVQSKYYNHEGDYIVNKIGTFNSETGEIEQSFIERISVLDQYIDKHRRDLQTIMQSLNYLPSGYFKMPEEMKKDIQENINEQVKRYVENYVVPDLDVQKTKESLDKVSI